MKRISTSLAIAVALTAGAASAGQISIPLDTELSAARAGSLTVTVNGVDHTPWAWVRDGQLFISDAPQPFETHNTVRLFIEADGTFEERGTWVIAHEPEDDLRATGTIGATAGVIATEQGGEAIGSVSGDLTASGRIGAWEFDAELESEAEFATPADIDDLTHATGNLRATRTGSAYQQALELGDQKIGRDRILLPDADRLGASFQVQSADQIVALAGYAFANEVPDFDNVVYRGGFSGAHLSFRPFGSNLTLNAGVVYGEGSQFLGDADRRGVNVGGSAVWLSDSGNTEAGTELVFSRQNVEGDGTFSDSAIETWLGHQVVLGDTGAIDPEILSLEVGFRQVGEDFFAFGSPYLSTDLRQVQLSAGYSAGPLSVSARTSVETDNIDNNPARETNQFAEVGVDAAYLLDANWTANFGGGLAVSRLVDSPFPGEVDSTVLTRFAYAGVSHAKGNWTWALTQSVSHITGNDLFDQDVVAVQTDLSATWSPVETLEITAYAQGAAFIDRDFSDATSLAFGGQVAWHITETLELTAALDAAVADQPGFDGTDARLALAWRADEQAVLTAFAGHSGGSLAPSAPFDGSYAGLSLTLEQPFSY